MANDEKIIDDLYLAGIFLHTDYFSLYAAFICTFFFFSYQLGKLTFVGESSGGVSHKLSIS